MSDLLHVAFGGFWAILASFYLNRSIRRPADLIWSIGFWACLVLSNVWLASW